MKLKKSRRGFWLCLALNMIFNLEWTVPAWILLALHFACGISLWWAASAFALWILILAAICLVIGWVSDCANEPAPKTENKNPYSVKTPNPYGNINKENGSNRV